MNSRSEKVIWITPAPSDIGEALAYALNRLGCRLILSARNTGKLNQIKKSCLAPGRVEKLPLELEEWDLMPRHAEKVVNLFRQEDILVNNAGISQHP